jgi:hypothetical protein
MYGKAFTHLRAGSGHPICPIISAGGTIPARTDGKVLMALERELATYKNRLPELKDQEGKFVLIHGDELVDFFSTYEDAIKCGYQRYKLEPFLVKQVHATEPVFFISRSVVPTRLAP